jgi:hypothetical protein
MLRTYSELIQFETFIERYRYLALRGNVGESTFGFDRWLNQQFYTSRRWRDLRHHIAVRDQGCDLAVPDREIHGRPIVHHMNPLRVDDIVHGTDEALDPEFLILTTHRTHNAIHYGDESLLPQAPTVRRAGDTQLWTRRSS